LANSIKRNESNLVFAKRSTSFFEKVNSCNTLPCKRLD